MAFEETTVGRAVLVKADGRIDMSNADAFRDALVSAASTARHAVIVDMAGVDYISSAGLRALMIALRSAKDAGKSFAVAALTPLVLEIFTISRFNLLFPMYGAVQEALEAVAPHEHRGARMRITFWGTRGSLPAPLGGGAVRRKLVNALVKAAGANLDTPEKAEAFCDTALSFPEQATFGGNTSCVQVDAGGPDYLLCDLGSGVREFSLAALGRHGPGKPQTYHVLVSHVHWDHIMGFPFFVPAFIPGNKIRIYSCHPHFEAAIRNQNHAPCFPVEFSALAASIEFIALEPEKPYEIAGCTVTGMAQLHGGESFGYRIEGGGRTAIYTTDAEYKPEDTARMERTAAFFKDADVVIFDSMYSLAESISVKEDWGHSSNIMGVELCHMAGARRLCLFHHEPVNDDDKLQGILNETLRYEEITRHGDKLDVVAAYDGLVLDI